ncbi:hypothetical protein TNCV_1618231 [Trichonephila clavipes]|nr:hypothetical protein TNCV_1618231 [Trichonephila clavipes]
MSLRLPLAPVHRQVQLQWCRVRLIWHCTDWRRIVLRDESSFQQCPDDNLRRVWRHPEQRRYLTLVFASYTGQNQVVMV